MELPRRRVSAWKQQPAPAETNTMVPPGAHMDKVDAMHDR